MKWLFALIIALCLGGAYAQTIQPTGGGGGVSSGSALTGCSTAGSILFNNSNTVGCDNGLTYAGASGVVVFGSGSSARIVGSSGIASFGAGGVSMGAAANSIVLWNGGTLSFAPGTVSAGNAAGDIGISRDSAGVLDVGNGTLADVTGAVKARSYIGGSTAPTTLGSCSFAGFVGGNTVGTFVTQGCGAPATAATAMILVFAQAAPNGWSCDAVDRTTAGGGSVTAVSQNASTVTAASFRATTTTGDVVQFKCMGY